MPWLHLGESVGDKRDSEGGLEMLGGWGGECSGQGSQEMCEFSLRDWYSKASKGWGLRITGGVWWSGG